jgi:hypothetical protein
MNSKDRLSENQYLSGNYFYFKPPFSTPYGAALKLVLKDAFLKARGSLPHTHRRHAAQCGAAALPPRNTAKRRTPGCARLRVWPRHHGGAGESFSRSSGVVKDISRNPE